MELTDLKGVGSVTVERLSEAGVEDVESLAKSNVDELTDAGVSDNKANRLIERAKQEEIIIKTGEDVKTEYDEKEYVPTGLEALDEILGGGWEPGFIAAVSGGSGGGKTQICFQAMINAVEHTGRPAIYIETEPGRYRPERLKNLSSKDDTQSNIFKIEAHDLDSQLKAIDKINNNYSKGDLSMVVIDSFTARFRLSDSFQSRSDLQNRSKMMGKHLTRLEGLAKNLDIPAVLTAQVYGNPGGYGSPESMYGGSLMQHTVGCIIQMKKAQGSLRKAKLTGHPGQEDAECHLTINDDEIRSVDAE